MANTLQLKNDIKKLKTALASKGLSASIKNKLKGKLEKAEKDLKSTAPRKASSAKSAIANLKELVKKKKYSIYKKSGVDLKKDSEEPALPIGRRVSKGLKGNQYGNKKSSKGNVYYEYRANRLDVKQPSKTAKYPRLADGGEVGENGYVAFYKGKQMDVYAKTSLQARDKAVKAFGAKKPWDVTVVLAEKDGKQVVHSASFAKGGKVKEPIVVRSYFEEEAYEYAKGGKLSKKDFFKKYEENEDENMHSENVVLLAENYGTESDIRDAKTILAKHESIGHLPTSLRQERDALHDKLYAKYVQSREYGGMMAKGGNVIIGKTKFENKFGVENKDFEEAIFAYYDSGSGDNVERVTSRSKLFKLQRKWGDEKNKEVMEYVKEKYKEIGVYKDGGMMAEGGVTEKEVVDSNAEMVLSNVKEVKHHADELSKVVTQKSNIEAWVVAKIERASTDLSDITHYLEGQHDKMSMGGSVYNHVHKMDKK